MTRSSILSWMVGGMPKEIWLHSNLRVCGSNVGDLLLHRLTVAASAGNTGSHLSLRNARFTSL